jgi:DNA-binding response OmpR family regulator
MAEQPEPALILTVDHNTRNLELLGEFLGRAGYRTRPAATLEAFNRALAEKPPIQMALLDVSGFGPEVWSACEELRARQIPFLIISPKHSAALQQTSLEHGARGVLVKPLAVKELLNLIQAMLKD